MGKKGRCMKMIKRYKTGKHIEEEVQEKFKKTDGEKGEGEEN